MMMLGRTCHYGYSSTNHLGKLDKAARHVKRRAAKRKEGRAWRTDTTRDLINPEPTNPRT